MLIDQYYNETDNKVTFTRLQASDFAKHIANDFNPLHNIDAKRFCVPGDLLFSLVLAKYGCSKQMSFTFSGMVTNKVTLNMPVDSPQFSINGDNDKEYLSIEHSGENTNNSELIDNLTRSYVTFSGHTFPHILVPLMEAQGMMINIGRPMVMYKSMMIELDRLDLPNVTLELDKEKTTFEVNGKRGNVCLAFNLIADQQIIGKGEKHMVLSGLKLFDKTAIVTLCADYELMKKNFFG
ncbi:MAG: DUF3581 domain-containing protein [Gammaproteobacteria bacterium]|nr:DUF3581 domain-containing protein [Gammaproteobacteria bacterium]